jgi:hypothetical protein
MGRYINKAKDSIDTASYRQGHKEAHGSSSKPLEKKLTKRHKGIETAVKKLTKEDAEQIDELSKDTMGRYINKAAERIGTKGVSAGLRIAADEKSSGNFKDMGKRQKGIARAVSKLTKEEQDFVDSLNDADMEQIDELSNKTLKTYVGNAYNDYVKKSSNRIPGEDETDAMKKRKKSLGLANKKLTNEETDQIDELSKATMGSYIKKASGAEQPKNVMSPKNIPLTKIAAYQGDSETGHFGKRFNQATYDKADRLRKNRSQGITRAADKLAKEETEITEARGRPKKAGARDFTIHPKTKEKLMHNNPEHMKRIERLQKTGMLQKPKTEAGQHIMNQLQKAKTSMTGGTTINFTHGDSKHVSGTHAARLLDKYAGMKPNEKETFQKKIGHSHENLKSEL